jgi:hypothetical protein
VLVCVIVVVVAGGVVGDVGCDCLSGVVIGAVGVLCVCGWV